MEKKEDRKVELKRAALALANGQAFSSWQVRNPSDVPMVFMVLALSGEGDIPADVAEVYEYMDQAGPRSINGYPIFFSCHTLNRDEALWVHTRARKIAASNARSTMRWHEAIGDWLGWYAADAMAMIKRITNRLGTARR